jgi:hypothetical protein
MAMRILGTHGQVLMDDSGGDVPQEAGRPEIDRVVLRDMLLDSLDPSTIQWGRIPAR